MNNINFAPYLGILMTLVGVVGVAFGVIPMTDSATLVTMGLGILGIHNSVTSLGRSLGSR